MSNNQDSERPVFSPILRQVRLPVANNLCTTAPFDIDDTQLCAGGKKGNQNIYNRSFKYQVTKIEPRIPVNTGHFEFF